MAIKNQISVPRRSPPPRLQRLERSPPRQPAEKDLPPIQLYDLAADIGETKNLQAEKPDVVARLTDLMKKYIADGRSTPGAKQANDEDVPLYPKAAAKKQQAGKGKKAKGKE